MTEFLVELYVSRTNAANAGREAERTRIAVEELTREGIPVRYLRSIFVPEDETCFLLLEAASAEHVREAARRAHVHVEHLAATSEHPSREETLSCP